MGDVSPGAPAIVLKTPSASLRLTSEPALLGRGYQGEAWRADSDSGPLILKCAHGRWPWRAARRWMLVREASIYARLAGVAGVPRSYGITEDSQLVLQFLPGPSLRAAPERIGDREAFFARLLQIIRAIHAAGVAHGDIRRKDNILIAPDGTPCVIDFGTAITRRGPAETGGGWLYRQFCRMDLNAWVNLKYQGQPFALTNADRELYRPTLIEAVYRPLRDAWHFITAKRLRRSWRRRRGGS
jgi:predicted Ser/Thr protein kinase